MKGDVVLPVLIVGGGPVGLSLAIDLGWRGVPAMMIEKEDADARREHPRMDNVGVRTMEFCRRWGIGGDVRSAGFPDDLPISFVYTTGVLAEELARDEYPDKAHASELPFSPERHELCPQNFFDPVLQVAASAYSEIRLSYRHRLVDLVQHSDHVEAFIEDQGAGRSFTVRARYLAACDGAGSDVARLVGVPQDNRSELCCSTNIFFHAPELARRTTGRRAYRYVLLGDENVWATMVNIDGRDIWRLQVLGDDRWPTWSEVEINAMVRRGIGADIPYKIQSWIPWSRREYVAPRFRVGRCFLVGDAAHQLSPTGGYGMNTGIAEAVDLSWKLAAVHQGWAGEQLLDSYDLERRPIADRNVRQATANLLAMRSVPPSRDFFATGERGEAARRETGLALQAAMQTEFRSFGIHLGAQYQNSPIIADEDEEPLVEQDVAAFVQSARPGSRAPHVWLSPGISTLDLFGAGFTLLDLSPHPGCEPMIASDACKATGVPLDYRWSDSTEARTVYQRRYTLVRPDGYVAWRGDALPDDFEQLLDRVRGGGVSILQTAAI